MKALVVVTLLCCLTLISEPCYCFDHKQSHPDLTKKAIQASGLQTYLVNYLGYSSGIDTNIYGSSRSMLFQYKKIHEWLQTGSTDEDALSTCRASNHFHNPIHTGDWTQSQQNDSNFVDSFCGTSNRYSDVTLATGFTSPAPGGSKIAPIGQTNGWDNARQYFYNALTTTDTYSNSSGTSKDNLYALTFRSLGMIMHLLQDMAVPAHVRNDMTSHLSVNRGVTNFGKNAFEKYVKSNNKALSKTPIIPVLSPIAKLTDFWDTNLYNGIEPDMTRYAGIGLAEYTNANFLSDFTIFDLNPTAVHYFPYPSSSSVSTGTKQIANPFMPGTTVPRQYYVKTSDGEVGYFLAGVGYLDAKAPGILVNRTKKIPPMDNNVHSDYAQLLLPRAVGYSAALLDYFFRGSIKLTATPTDITFRSIKVTAQNDTTGESMALGDVSLVVRYKAMTETSLGGGKFLLSNPSADYTYKVVTLPSKVDMSSPQMLTFDFSSNSLPMNFSDMTMQLVYKGKLGNEDNAVAISELIPIDGIATDFTISLPPSGVYAKTSDNSSTAAFSELRVNAMTDIPGGLAGGTISLALEYRTAIGDQFQSELVDTEPVNGAGYIYRAPVKNGVTFLPENTPVELVFDLSQLPVQAAGVELNIMYTMADGTTFIAVNDIAEPTPVDAFNNSDYTCINNLWYRYDEPESIAIRGVTDTTPHLISDIAFLTGPAGSSSLNPVTTSNLFAAGPVQAGAMIRLGYILTDYSNSYIFRSTRLGNTSFPYPVTTNTQTYPGAGFRNDRDTQNAMFAFRGKQMWGGRRRSVRQPGISG